MTVYVDNPLHLVLGDCAAAIVRNALRSEGLPGRVHCIHDDLGFGPLHDGVERMQFWRRCFDGFDDWRETGTDAFADWRDLQRQMTTKPQPLVIWRAENVSETVLLAMTCWWFNADGVALFVAEREDGRHTGVLSSADLPRVYARRRQLSTRDIEIYASTYERLRTDSDSCRVWHDGSVEAAPVSTFDDLVIDACARAWRPAAQVVGTAMAAAPPRNALSDVFFSTRLHALIAAGRIEADAPATHLRHYAVRLASRACNDDLPTCST